MDKRLRKVIQPGFNLYLIVFLIFSAFCAMYSVELAGTGVGICVLLFAINQVNMRRRRHAADEYLKNLVVDTGSASGGAMTNFPIPCAVITATTGEILWCNEKFDDMAGRKDCALNVGIHEVAPEFDTKWIIEGKEQFNGEIKIGKKYYFMYGNLVRGEEYASMLVTLYFAECTEFVDVRARYEKSRPVITVLSIDSYDELTKNATDSEKSSILADIDKKISLWAKDTGALLRKYDRDKYIFVVENAQMHRLMEEKFSVLEQVRTVQSRDGIRASLSIGIGRDGESFEENYRFAGLALEMALSRGGDQAVIKNKFAFEFFGGLSNEVEKRTKVKSRVIANALTQLVRDSSRVLVMGHTMSDIDAVGAAVGVVCAVKSKDKPVNIVINKERTSAAELIARMEALPEYKGIFISPEEAMVICDFNTLLVVVDTNRPDYVESPALLESIQKVAVIDHHRRAASYIQNAALNLHEPYASSACELVAELLQYMVPNQQIMREEAESLLAGIYLDTKGFAIKAGVRTFEAAAYLKRAGADMVAVKKLFQTTFDEYMIRQSIIAGAAPCAEGVILAVSEFEPDRAVAAKAADELLDIIGVRASIVAFRSGEDTIISARSLGKINVQVLMEKLGGGGNLSSAGAQLKGVPLEVAQERIHSAVQSYLSEYEL